jgi:hypothetical protein
LLGRSVFAERQSEEVIGTKQLAEATIVGNQRGDDAEESTCLSNPIALLEVSYSQGHIYQSRSIKAAHLLTDSKDHESGGKREEKDTQGDGLSERGEADVHKYACELSLLGENSIEETYKKRNVTTIQAVR